ncbi:MAG: Ig-like domain-containing protein [Gammaproteobacteria bacterium]
MLDVLANDTDADGGPRSIASVTAPLNGTVVITNAGADLTYQPDPDFCNEGGPTDDFSYTLTPGGSTGSGRKTVVLAELNDDSKLDIAVPSSNSATLSVFLNTSSLGTLSVANRSDYSVGANPFSLAAGDINGDSKPELVTGNVTDNTVSILSRHQNTSLTVSINDQGHSGSGGPLTDNETIPLVTD